MAQFVVDSNQVALASAQTAAIANQIRTDAANMMAQVQSLQSSWTGAGASSFADCANRWHAAQTQMEQALDEIGIALRNASVSYEETESGITGMFAG